jgi:hypothetical protein
MPELYRKTMYDEKKIVLFVCLSFSSINIETFIWLFSFISRRLSSTAEEFGCRAGLQTLQQLNGGLASRMRHCRPVFPLGSRHWFEPQAEKNNLVVKN